MKTRSIILSLMIFGVGVFLFFVANEVVDKRRELARVQHEILETTQAIHVLRAEWSYLNAPMRLEALSGDFLGLEPVKTEQYTSIDQLPFARTPAPPPGTDENLPAPLETPAAPLLLSQATPAAKPKTTVRAGEKDNTTPQDDDVSRTLASMAGGGYARLDQVSAVRLGN